MEDKQYFIQELIESADQVLIGIGEELALNKKNIENTEYFETYMKKKKAEQIASSQWMEDYLYAYFASTSQDENIKKAYENLYQLVKNKNYFIVTQNTDSFLKNAGFLEKNIVSPCGSFDRLQCSDGCGELWESKEMLSAVISEISREDACLADLKQPFCKKCGAAAEFNVVGTKNYSEEGYLQQWEVYTKWLSQTLNKKVFIMELGVGFTYPSVIRWPFEKIAFYNQKTQFVRVNGKFHHVSEDFENRETVYSIQENAINFLYNLVD